MSELETLTKLARQQAETVMLGKKEEFLTVFLLKQRDGKSMIIGCPWRDDREKRDMVMQVCMEIVKTDVVAFSFASECWTATVKTEGDKLPPPLGPRPKDRSDRKEAIVTIVGDGKELKLESWEIVRDRNGRCVRLGENDSQAGFESWIGTALNRAIQFKKIDGWPR